MTSKKPKDPHNFKEVGDYYVKDSLGEGVNGAVKLGVHKKDGIKVNLLFIFYFLFNFLIFKSIIRWH